MVISIYSSFGVRDSSISWGSFEIKFRNVIEMHGLLVSIAMILRLTG